MKKKTLKPWILPAVASIPVLILALMLIAAALSSDGTEYFLPSLRYGGVFAPSGFSLFGISAYYLMQIVGAALGYWTVITNRELFGLSFKNTLIVTTALYIQAVIGFKLFYALQHCIGTGDFSHWDFSGASLYGAIFGMVITAPLLAAVMKLPGRSVQDIFAAAGIVYLACGRLGCFFTGCCGSKLFFVGVHPIYFPVQLTEVFFDLVIAAVLYYRCFCARERGRFYIGAMPSVLMMYGTVRFFLEFLRTDPVTAIGLTEAQISSLLIIAIGTFMTAHSLRKRPPALPTEKKERVWLIPALVAIPVAGLAIFLVMQALASDGSVYPHPFITYGGAIKPVLTTVLGLKLYVFIDGLGAAAGVSAAVLLARRMNIKTQKAFAFAVTALLAGYAGGKVLYAIERIYDIGHFRIYLGGQSLFGVVYFALIFTPLIGRIYALKSRTAYDIAAVMWLVCFIFARTGCIFSGCCGGKTFMAGTYPVTAPVQLLEIVCNLLILAFCLRYILKKRKNADRYAGAFPVFLMSYSAVRFLLEFLRTNPVTALGMTEAQKHATVLFTAGLIMAFRAKPYEAEKKTKKKKK